MSAPPTTSLWPLDVLGGGVRHHVDAAIERVLQDGRGEGAVADGDRIGPGCAHDRGDRREVRDLHERVRRRLDPDQARVRAHRGADIVEVRSCPRTWSPGPHLPKTSPITLRSPQ